MESNKFISVSYQLYDITDGKSDLIEQTSDERPFIFVSGMGVTLPAFEEQIVNLAKGESFRLYTYTRAGLWRTLCRACHRVREGNLHHQRPV